MSTETVPVEGQPIASERLYRLMNPKSVMIVGASDKSAWSHYIYDNLRSGGFSGDIYLVNRRGEDTHGQKAFRSISELPSTVDLGFLLTGPATVQGILDESVANGTRDFVALTAGLSETGAQGKALQDEIVNTALRNDQLILGPNNLGFVNATNGICAFAQMLPHPLIAEGVGFASQSGALVIYLLPLLKMQGIGVSQVITLGNEAMVSTTDAIDYLLDDDQTRVIALYLEQIRDTTRFRELAERAQLLGKPIVMFKAGRGKSAARVAAAHTGALVGDDRVVDAVCKQYGVIRVDSIEDLATTAGLLDAYGEIPGRAAAFIVGSGAMCATIAERSDACGLELATFSSSTIEGLREDGLPEIASINNPLDMTGGAGSDAELTARLRRRVVDDPHVDVLVFNGNVAQNADAAAFMARYAQTVEALVRSSAKPVIAMSFLPDPLSEFAVQWTKDVGHPRLVESFDRGIPALVRAMNWTNQRAASRARTPESEVQLIERPPGAATWSEFEQGKFLRQHGIPYIESALCKTADEAANAATRTGFPVVLKVASPDVEHKTEVGGVALGLNDESAVREAFALVTTSVHQALPDAAINGVMVAPMRDGGVELIVGVIRDPDWGPVLAVGLGGVFVELLKESVVRVLPVSKGDIRGMLSELRGSEIFDGFRGSKPVAMDELVDAIYNLTRLAIGLGDQIDSIEINPLRASSDRIEALDALIAWT